MSTHPQAGRLIQSNDVASIVIQQAAEHVPGLFVTLDFRYGIADALWAAGYRKNSEVERLCDIITRAHHESMATDLRSATVLAVVRGILAEGVAA